MHSVQMRNNLEINAKIIFENSVNLITGVRKDDQKNIFAHNVEMAQRNVYQKPRTQQVIKFVCRT
jgi:hypothetical protein